MPKFILFGWVKNASKLFIGSGVGSVLLSTNINKVINIGTQTNGKLSFIQLSTLFLSTYFSTAKFDNLYLLDSFYTHNPQGLLLRPLMRI